MPIIIPIISLYSINEDEQAAVGQPRVEASQSSGSPAAQEAAGAAAPAAPEGGKRRNAPRAGRPEAGALAQQVLEQTGCAPTCLCIHPRSPARAVRFAQK